MEEIYSVEEIHNIEKKEFKKLKSSYVLMKRAGTNCAKKIYKSKLNSKFIVLCGPGNNGGDGLVISQGLIGYIQYATGLPELVVGFHLLGAALVWGSGWSLVKVAGSGFRLKGF